MDSGLYIFKDKKITGPDNFIAEISKDKESKNISITGSASFTLGREGNEYTIDHNFLNYGHVQKNSIMDYDGNTFSIDKKGLKKMKANKIKFDIIFNSETIAGVYAINDTLNLNLQNKNFLFPVVIYIAILSLKIKSKYGKIYIKNSAYTIPSIGYILLYILPLFGIGFFSSSIFWLTLLPFLSLIIFLLEYIIIRPKLF